MNKRLLVAALGALGALGLLALAGTSRAPAAGRQEQGFTVRSTLAGKTLPHRIHWFAFPSIPPAEVAEVDFLIDGKLSWVEHHAPYSYGYNANYLVTSWLTPGLHHFLVRAVAIDGGKATAAIDARVLPAAAPPARLAGTWKRTLSAQQAGKQPAGTWVLSISKVGWKIAVPPGGANLIDVGYLATGLLEVRGGIWTKPAPKKGNPEEGNGWCDEPFQPVRYHWAVSGTTLTLALAGPKRCDGQSVIVAGSWSR